MLKRTFLVGVLVVSTMLMPGCGGLFENSCGASYPIIQQSIVYGADAEAAIHRAELAFYELNVDDETSQEVIQAFSQAWDALRTAQVELLAASEKCTKLDPLVAFADFIKIWHKIANLLSGASPRLQASIEAGSFAPMIVWKADRK